MPFDIPKLVNVIRRFLWIPLLTALAGLVIAGFYAKHSKNAYRSTAVIRVERRASAPTTADSTAFEGATTPEDLKTIEQSFLSPFLMQRVVEKLGLTSLDDFLGPGRPAAGTTADELAGYLISRSSVALVPETRLIQVSFEHWNPGLAQSVCDAIAEQGVAYDREQRSEALSENAQYLRQEADKFAASLQASEEKLSAYRRKLGSVSIDPGLDIVSSQLRNLNERLTTAKAERLRLESDYEQIQSFLDDPDKLLSIESIRKVPAVERLYARAGELRGQLVKLAQRYREGNPLVKQTETELGVVEKDLRNEILQAPRSIEVALAAARRNEESIAREQAAQEKSVIEMKELSIEAQNLQSQINVDRAAYENMLRRLNEELSQARSQPVILQIVEPASPGFPVGTKIVKVLPLGLLVGFMAGAGILFLIMQVDPSIQSEEEVEKLLRLPVLAAISVYTPSASRAGIREPSGWRAWAKRVRDFRRGAQSQPALPGLQNSPMIREPHSAVAEAFRTLRASLQIAEENPRSSFVLLTSPLPSEGKSFCSLNLSVAYARSGLRTLLVDAEMRRPALEERFFGTAGGKGLTDFLREDAGFSSVIRPTEIPHLDIVTAGSSSEHLTGILSPDRIREFLDAAKPHYDRVVFDSAPVNTVSDTLLFARFFGTVCLVVRVNRTPRQAIGRAAGLLARAGARLSGAIVNFLPEDVFSDEKSEAYYSGAHAPEDAGFPLTCPGCGRTYETAEEYIKATTSDAARESSAFRPASGFRCTCGTLLVQPLHNRRDSSEVGKRRRTLFGELLDRMVSTGAPRDDARAKLLLALKICRYEDQESYRHDRSEAGIRRRKLFMEIQEALVQSGLGPEEAQARLLEAIRAWRNGA